MPKNANIWYQICSVATEANDSTGRTRRQYTAYAVIWSFAMRLFMKSKKANWLALMP